MHEINWKWQNKMAKMFMSTEMKAILRKAPEHPLSPEWVTTLDTPGNRQGGSWPPLITESVSNAWPEHDSGFGLLHLGTPLTLAFIYHAI